MERIEKKVAVVIPAFQAERYIIDVIRGIPDFVSWIVVVNDCSRDATSEIVSAISDRRVHLINLERNLGVGGATLNGYQAACELGADIIVKMDSDGQMDPAYLPALIAPIAKEEADYTKGNRFMHLRRLQSMPVMRRFGNLGLSFLNKMCSGYWNIFDPTNGYTAISANMLSKMDFASIHPRYFFESSMLLELGLQRAVVRDVFIPARYNGERSSLSELDSFLRFPPLLIKGFLKRFFIQYLVRDFSAVTLFVIFGIPLILFGFIFGLVQWARSAQAGIPATPGTVMLAMLPFILGWQFIMQALIMDIQNVPRKFG